MLKVDLPAENHPLDRSYHCHDRRAALAQLPIPHALGKDAAISIFEAK